MLNEQKPGATFLLLVNAGSSSLKLVVYRQAEGIAPVLKGAAELIGQPGATLRRLTPQSQDASPLRAKDQLGALNEMLEWVFGVVPAEAITAVGHRVVHGGPKYHSPTVIDDEVVSDLRSYSLFDPEHLPSEIDIIEALRSRLETATQIACFDTAFYSQLPELAQTITLPAKYQREGVRRYGFHGLSYEYLLSELKRLDGEPAANGRVALAHLGSGASLTAVMDGRPVDTTMGFSPASGIMMSTRSGDLDPGAIVYLQKRYGLSPDDINHLINTGSGLLGVSETSADMYALLQAEANDQRAKLAVDLFCYQVKKSIGALASAMGGLDTIIFSGGIGQNASMIRQRACSGLDFLGVKLDEKSNAANAPQISAGKVKVRVIKANEELVMARQVLETVRS